MTKLEQRLEALELKANPNQGMHFHIQTSADESRCITYGDNCPGYDPAKFHQFTMNTGRAQDYEL